MKLLKDLSFLVYITVVGMGVFALVMLVVPILECLITGKTFFNL